MRILDYFLVCCGEKGEGKNGSCRNGFHFVIVGGILVKMESAII